MLRSPSHAVIGSSDLAASIGFLGLFGFVETARARLPGPTGRALYGLDRAADEVVLAAPGADLGWLRLVETPHPARHYATLDNRAFAIDFFSTDLDRSVAIAAAAGHHASPIGSYAFGPITIREVEICGPDGLIVTLLDSPVKRPTLLDQAPDRLHSELHALVWSVTGMAEKLPFWQQAAGLQTVTDATFSGDEMGKVLGLPGRTLEARLVVLCDEDSNPSRLELIEFLGEPAADHANWPLAGGLHAPAFHAESLEATMSALSSATFGAISELDTPVHQGACAVSAEAPGGLRFEIWQEG